MKVITKAGLIAKFGEHNGTIFWNRHVNREASQKVMQASGEGFRRPKKGITYGPLRNKLIRPSEPQGEFLGRMQKIEEQFLSGERVIGDAICMSLPHNSGEGEV